MYYLKINETNDIIGFLTGKPIDDTYIEVSQDEYEKAFKYKKFNPRTREFSELRDIFDGNLQLKKEEKIEQSKQILKKWLVEHPLESNVTGKKALYTVTEEKQALLTRNLMIAQLNGSNVTTWNSQGGICEEWEVNKLAQLALEIEEYVRPRIKKQQHYEVQINGCTNIEEVEGIEINYETTI